MTITATIAGAISMLAQFGMFFGGNRDSNSGGMGIIGTLAMVILAPIAAMLVQMAISRTREYAADNTGAEIDGGPMAGLGARQARSCRASVENMTAERNPATAHLFIVNPLSRPAHGQSVLDPSVDRESHRGAAGARAAHGAKRRLWRRHPARPQAQSTPAYGKWGGGRGERAVGLIAAVAGQAPGCHAPRPVFAKASTGEVLARRSFSDSRKRGIET